MRTRIRNHTSSSLLSELGFATHAFVAIMTFCVFYGLGLTALSVWLAPKDSTPLMVCGLLGSIIGAFICGSRDSMPRMLVGYHVMTICFGLALGTVLKTPNTIILQVIAETACVTVIAGAIGLLFPAFYRGLSGILFLGLIALIALRIGQIFIPWLNHCTWIDYGAVLLFALYVGHDLVKALEDDHTASNAVFYGISLYLDVLNLFMTLLRLRSNDD